VIEAALRVIQLSEFGDIDDSIGFEFLSLWELDEAEKAGIEKTRAETDAVLMAGGVIDNEEARDRLRHDAGSDYQGLTGPAPEGSDPSPPSNDDPDPDDEEIETPKDVIEMLGFDPAKE